MSSQKLLIFSDSRDTSTNTVIDVLNDLGTPWVRMNFDHPGIGTYSSWGLASSTDSITCDGVDCAIRFGDSTLVPENVAAVWYRRPVIAPVTSGELSQGQKDFFSSETRHYWYGYFNHLKSIRWVNPWQSASLTKLQQLHVAWKNGLNVPPTLVSNDPQDIRQFAKRYGSIIAKPVYCGLLGMPMGRTEAEDGTVTTAPFAYTQAITLDELSNDLELATLPAIYQKHIRKSSELRVTIIGNQVLAVAMDTRAVPEANIDWRVLGPDIISKVKHEIVYLPEAINSRLLTVMGELGLIFGCVDLILDEDNQYVFLEVNPFGQWGWLDVAVDIDITGNLARYLHSLVV